MFVIPRALAGGALGCLMVFVAACSSAPPGPTAPGGATPTPQGATPVATAVPRGGANDACGLLTDAEILEVTGHPVLNKTPGAQFGGTSGCEWLLDSGTQGLTWDIALDVQSPGGRAVYDQERGFSPDAAAIPGLGDAAFQSVANSVVAVKGDTRVDLQYIAFEDGSDLVPAELIRRIFAKI
jgi:hypothetical protein